MVKKRLPKFQVNPKVVILILCLSNTLFGYSQVLFTESFSVILDTTKSKKGIIIPDLKFQTQRKNLFEFQNIADISIRIKKSALTFANKIELSKFGKETFLSGGYLYSEYRRLFDNKVTHESFAQIQWAEARGLELKYAFGTNLRYRLVTNDRLGIYFGIGPFYEFERWNYKGVSDTSLLPSSLNPIESTILKIGSYASIKYQLTQKVFLDLSLYHQNKIERFTKNPRLASSSRVTYEISEHLGFSFIYQTIYDFNPIVPIDKDFHRIISSVSISF